MKAKKSDKYEPTLTDVLKAVQVGFERVENQFVRHGKILTTLHEGQENLKEQLNENTRRLGNTQTRVEDIADMLEDVAQTARKSAQRITHLEKMGT